MKEKYSQAHVVSKTVSRDSSGIYIAKDYTDADNYFNNRLHCHNFWEFNFIISGEGLYTINNENVEIKRGMVYLMTPADFHACSLSGSESFVSYCLQFYPSQLDENVSSLLYSSPVPIVFQADEEKIGAFTETLDRLVAVFDEKGPFYELFARNSIENICILLAQEVNKIVRNSDVSSVVRNAVVFVKDHYREKITLHDAASNARLSDAYFSHIFSQVMGIGFTAYLKNFRMNAACELLNSTDLSVKEICFSCGFNDPNYFSDSFSKRFGISPRVYRGRFGKSRGDKEKKG